MKESDINYVLDTMYKMFPNTGIAELVGFLVNENQKLNAKVEALSKALQANLKVSENSVAQEVMGKFDGEHPKLTPSNVEFPAGTSEFDAAHPKLTPFNEESGKVKGGSSLD